MSQWISPALISGAFVLFAVFIGIAETRQENRYWDIVRRLEAAQEPAEALDSRVSVTYERMAWLEGYASCQGDVFPEVCHCGSSPLVVNRKGQFSSTASEARP